MVRRYSFPCFVAALAVMLAAAPSAVAVRACESAGATLVDRIRHTGYLSGANSWSLGENLAWGSHNRAAPRAITEMWMNSAGHRANILSPAFREVGIGLALGAPGPSGPGATYATEFGSKG